MGLMTVQELTMLGAVAGAYSVLSKREGTGDRSITVDRHEKSVLSHIYPPDTFKRKGGAADDGKNKNIKFLTIDYDNYFKSYIKEVPLVYPKQDKNELRLYMQDQNGFSGNPNDVFVIFYKSRDPYPTIGFIPEGKWNNFFRDMHERNNTISSIDFQDIEDSEYQRSILLVEAGAPIAQTRLVQQRDPNIARQAIIRSQYQCDIDINHVSFISPTTQEMYMEAHHIIPMSQQKSFNPVSLDQIDNVVSLCPTCHKKIHLGTVNDKVEMLKMQFQRRIEFMSTLGVDLNKLLSFYGVPPR